MSFENVTRRVTRALTRVGMNAMLDRTRTVTRAGSSVPTGHEAARRTPIAAHERDTTDGGYLGDWCEPLPSDLTWQARDDGLPDPGEVVWAWVPYEEDHAKGKDRPSLVIARHPRRADVVLALPLTSKDHDRDAAQEARAGRHWMDLGPGAWDARGRPSEVRLDRVLQLRNSTIRREGAALDHQRFDAVIAAVRAGHRAA